MININYDNDANIIFNNLFTEANKKLRLREHMDSRKNFKERMFDLFLAVLVFCQVYLGDKLVWVYGLHTVPVVEAVRSGALS